MILPPYLRKGDTLAIVSTARKISLAEIEPAIDLLKNWGLKIHIGDSINLENNQFAGTDEQRAKDFQKQLDDPNISAIWCARGGYGTVRIVDRLNFKRFREQPKWIVGYSDVTVLHSALNTMGFASIHATMPVNIAENSTQAVLSLKNALFGEHFTYEIPFHPANRTGSVMGELVGGNLSILYSLLGSKTSIATENKILFIEDLDEYLYHLDRMLMNLKRNNLFNGLNGLIVGGLTQMHDNEIPFGKTAIEIVQDIVAPYEFPVLFGFPAGHFPDNRALFLGNTVELNVETEASSLRFLK